MSTKATKKFSDDPFINALHTVDEFILTDIACDALYDIAAYAARQKMRESEKTQPNLQDMEDMEKLLDEASDLLHNPKTFATRASMIAIIQKYSARLRELSETKPDVITFHIADTGPANILEIPEDDFFKILHQAIIPIATGKATPQKGNATAIIVGGQPGAGTKNLQQKALEQLQNNAVICDIDILGNFYPYIEFLENEDMDDYIKYRDIYAQRWNDEVIKYCLHNNMNFIMLSHFTEGERINELMGQIKGYSDTLQYKIDVMLMAVKPEESWAALQQRYEIEKLRSK